MLLITEKTIQRLNSLEDYDTILRDYVTYFEGLHMYAYDDDRVYKEMMHFM